MNIVILGIADSIFTRDYCEYVLDGHSNNIVLISERGTENYAQDYERLGIKLVPWPEFFKRGFMGNIKCLKRYKQECRKLMEELDLKDGIDVIHCQYFVPLHVLYFRTLWKSAKRRIITFWGGDYADLTPAKRRILFPGYLKEADSIVFMIEEQIKAFKKEFGHKYDSKVTMIDFGNSNFESLDRVLEDSTLDECKEEFGFAPENLTIHIGYNAYEQQNHMRLLSEILKVKKELRKNITVVFPMNYCRSESYGELKENLTDACEKAGLRYAFSENYLKQKELSAFRRSCDIFLYGQDNDARSFSPIEYVYSGSNFICPGYLYENYKPLFEKAGFKAFVYKDFNEIAPILEEILRNGKADGISVEGRRVFRDELSWESLAKKWRLLYER